jgi:hypothetical protein
MNVFDWRLEVHGDSRERRWARRVRTDFPAYEELWRKHIVPLTFRVLRDPAFKYVRPTQPAHYLDLADANYATFYHLTSCYEWKDRLAGYPADESVLPTESFYCFMAHAISCADSVLWFADAVNRVLDPNGGQRPFDLVEAKDSKGKPRGHYLYLRRCVDGPSVSEFQALGRELRDYRNLVIHRRPLFMLSKSVPRKSGLGKYCGLAAISRLAMNLEDYEHHFRGAEEVLEEQASSFGRVLDPLWIFATKLLDGLPVDRLRAREVPNPEDAKLTRSRINQAIGLGRTAKDMRRPSRSPATGTGVSR